MSTLAQALSAGCAHTRRERPYREVLPLRDGRRVTLRPLLRSDAGALRQFFFASLSPQGRLLRFHGVVNDLSADALRAMTTQTPGRQLALTALACTDDGLPQLLAEARYVVEDGGAAEFALAVADAWQGQGLGRALLQRLARHAQAEGLAVLRGSVVPDNAAMLHLMDSLGAERWGHAPEVTVRLPLRGG